MKKKTIGISLLVLIPILGVVIWGILSPVGIRAAVNDNLWSLRNIRHFYNPSVDFPQFENPPRTHPHAPIFLALKAIGNQEYDQALAYIQPLIDAADPLATNTYAQILFNMGKYEDAYSLWEKTGNTRELEKAAASVPEGRSDLNIMAYRSLYRINPQKYSIELAIRLRNNSKYAEVVELMQKSIQDFPRSEYQALWRRYLGDTYVLQGDLEHAEQAYRFAMLAPEPEYEAWRNLGFLYWQTGEYEKAVVVFHELSNLYPQDPYPLTLIAESYKREGSIQKALEAYQEALKLDPENDQIKSAIKDLSKQN